ncbi:MAG: DNA repair protein RadC [Eubacteriales bacterium]|nr:DNA repair protein RadC [Eubacteriales bacterium]
MPKTMKQLPQDEKPYEKTLRFGTQALTDAELLAVILRTGAQGISALDLSKSVLNASAAPKGLLGLHHLTVNDLMKIHGIGKVKAIQIQCILELSRRIAKATHADGLRFEHPSTIADYYMEDFRHSGQEQIVLMMLNTRCKLLGEKVISKGTVSGSLISPREIFLEALHYQAVTIVLVHNHPSGDPTPSQDDIWLTRRVAQAGELIGIHLMDHVILGDHTYVSMREEKILCP